MEFRFGIYHCYLSSNGVVKLSRRGSRCVGVAGRRDYSILIVNDNTTNLSLTLEITPRKGIVILDGNPQGRNSACCTRNNVTTMFSRDSAMRSRMSSALVTNTRVYSGRIIAFVTRGTGRYIR